ncbi:tyrosine-type recombinase/integrase [Brevibacillus sp. NRS-1366]|uniref:tyrosine-type recombinase/integrase n=1 Tax=Brevibacillus sp. NRS-1366 TaxID=3233899 RepID=UPI003D219A37
MNKAISNVTSINVSNVYNAILAFLDDVGSSSDKTKISYKYDIEQFFFYIRKGKQINQLTPDDIHVTRPQVIDFRNHLQRLKQTDGETPKYSNTSINRKIAVLKSLYSELPSYEYDVDPVAFNVRPLPERVNSIGFLTWEEVNEMGERVKAHKKGMEKSLLIRLAAQTSIRKDAILHVTWNNFKMIDGVPVLSVYDKGNVLDEKAIPEQLYNEILTLKSEETSNEDRVFTIESLRTLDGAIIKLCKEMGIPKERNISFHSLKKAGVAQAYIESNYDIKVAQQQANHADPSVTMKTYLPMVKNYSEMASYTMGQGIDLSRLENMTKEEIIALIHTCSTNTKVEIANKLK